jgi:hypothetical protein
MPFTWTDVSSLPDNKDVRTFTAPSLHDLVREEILNCVCAPCWIATGPEA